MPSLVTLCLEQLCVCLHVFWRMSGFGRGFAGKVGSHAFNASRLMLAFPRSPTAPLTYIQEGLCGPLVLWYLLAVLCLCCTT